MKNIIIIVIFSLSLVGCGGSSDGSSDGIQTTTTADFTQFFDSVFSAAATSTPVDVNNVNLVDNDADNPDAYNSKYGL